MSHSILRTLLHSAVLTSLAWHASVAQAVVESPRVLASRREVRVVFPRDTARTWGWSEKRDQGYLPSYVWGVVVEGMDGPRILWARLDGHSDEQRRFPSLDRLVAAARAQRCFPGMIAQCTDSGMRVRVEQGQVILTLRDSAQIARLFGMRPASLRAWHRRPGEEDRYSSDTVRIEYVSPDIPLPTAATRRDAARSRRRYEASISTVSRFIRGGDPWHPLWLEVGDSVAVSVGEMHCRYDSCSSGGYAILSDSGWAILDSSIARLELVRRDSSDDIEVVIGGRERRYVKGLRPGHTVLRVHGMHGASDTAASSTPPARQIEREIIVAPPIARVEIVPRADSVRALDTVTLRVRVIDLEGREVDGLPWQLELLDGESRGIHLGPEPQPIVFSAPGKGRVTARLGAHTDTLLVTVVPAKTK